MKKFKSIIFLLGITVSITAQNPDNLVPNPSFETLEGKLKSAGEILLAYPWESVNMNPVDLYSEASKADEYSVPENRYGEEKARTGSNYAGVSFYGYRGKEPRTYLGTQLTEPLEAGKQYCMKFHVSLSDKSKYAANNLAMYVSKESARDASEKNLAFDPQIMSVTNKVYEKQYLWTPICGTYTATGGEKYIVIGNFFTDEKTEIETIRMSKGFSGRQEYNAYYYVDDVSVIPTEKLSKKDCACDDIAGGAMEVEFKKFSTDSDLKSTAKKTYFVNSDGTKAEESIKKEANKANVKELTSTTVDAEEEIDADDVKEEIELTPVDGVIYFDSKKSTPKTSEDSKVEDLANYLKANSTVKILIEGHSDPSEAEVKFLGKRRGLAIEKQLNLLGVSETQMEYVSRNTSMPASSAEPSKNQRVTFSIK